ncbi:MAG: DNA mismatch repair endonuclease MutL [Eubacteriales bacterium]
MINNIRVLDQQCINQIAAGEVIERPLSVVKELVENSLDANANKIDIVIKGNGTELIRVSDNGTGINLDDLRVAVLPHATSKISNIEDLDSLFTLGFRGEALPSITSVSKIDILTRTVDSVSGCQLSLEGGREVEFKEIGLPIGTTVIVKDLFFNTPARYKFLRSTNTEFGLISDLVSRLAVARPDTAFSLKHPDKFVLKTSGNNLLLDTIAAVFGNNIAKHMIPINLENDKWKINGYISSVDFVRNTKTHQIITVNNRIVRSQIVGNAVKRGYHTLIPINTYPIIMLNIFLQPKEYDVNVHPSKMEIKFHQEQELTDYISANITKVLMASKPLQKYITLDNYAYFKSKNTPNNNNYNEDTVNSIHSVKKSDLLTKSNIWKTNNNDANYKQEEFKQILERVPLENTIKENKKENKKENLKINSTENITKKLVIPDDTLACLEKSKNNSDNYQISKMNSGEDNCIFLELRALAQIFNTYILATNEKSLYILDQHAAHERINYERLTAALRTEDSFAQMTLLPVTIELTLLEEQIVLENFELLNKMGFTIEMFGEKTYLLRSVPLQSGLDTPEVLFKKFIDSILENNIVPELEDMLEKWITMLACRESIKGHEKLSLMEMEELIYSLSKCNNPYTCPHGRPTVIEISKKELEKRFYRI